MKTKSYKDLSAKNLVIGWSIVAMGGLVLWSARPVTLNSSAPTPTAELDPSIAKLKRQTEELNKIDVNAKPTIAPQEFCEKYGGTWYPTSVGGYCTRS